MGMRKSTKFTSILGTEVRILFRPRITLLRILPKGLLSEQRQCSEFHADARS